METNQICASVVDASLRVHRELGPGLLESVYDVVLAHLLAEQGLSVERQKPIPIRVFGKSFDEGFRADLIVNECVLVELTSVERLARVHHKQVLSYLRLADLKVGLLIDFGGELLKGNIERIVVGEAPDLRKGASTRE